jgi:hypothetical protein
MKYWGHMRSIEKLRKKALHPEKVEGQLIVTSKECHYS